MADTVSSHLHVQLSEAPPPVLLLGPPPEGLLQLVDPHQELLPLRLEDMAVGPPPPAPWPAPPGTSSPASAASPLPPPDGALRRLAHLSPELLGPIPGLVGHLLVAGHHLVHQQLQLVNSFTEVGVLLMDRFGPLKADD